MSRPDADPFHRREMLDHFFVAELVDSLKNNRALPGPLCQVEDVGALLFGEANGAQFRRLQLQNSLGGELAAVSRSVHEAVVNDAGHVTAQLLKHDGAHQRREHRLEKLDPVGAGLLDNGP